MTDGKSQDELTRVLNLWRSQVEAQPNGTHTNPYASLFQYVHPLVIGAVDRSSSLSIKLCKEILSYHMKDEAKAEQVSRHLCGFFLELLQRHINRSATHGRPAASKRSDSVLHHGRVAVDHRAIVDADPKLIGGDLR